MQKALSLLARFGAVLCIILFTLTFVVALILVNAESQLFKAEPYKDALQISGIYDRLPHLLSKQLLADQPQEKPGFLNYLNAQDWEILISTIFPPQDMRRFSEQALDQVFNSLNGTNPISQEDIPAISLLPIKQSIRENGAQAIKSMLLAHPNCSVAELTTLVSEFAFGFPRTQGQLCNPPPEISTLVSSAIHQAMLVQAALLPEAIPLASIGLSVEAMSNINRARLMMRFGLLVPLVFLLLIGMLAGPSWKSGLRWLGVSLMTGGLLCLLIGMTSVPITQLILTASMPSPQSNLAAALLDVLWLVIQEVTFPVVMQSLVVILLGLGISFIGYYKRRPHVIIIEEPDAEPI